MRTYVDMEKTPAEVQDDIKSMVSAPSTSVYPYGLCISLTEEELEKLDLDDDCEVGDMISFSAMARVTSRSENEREDAGGKKTSCCRIELQITAMAVDGQEGAPAMSDDQRAKSRYANGADDDEGDE